MIIIILPSVLLFSHGDNHPPTTPTQNLNADRNTNQRPVWLVFFFCEDSINRSPRKQKHELAVHGERRQNAVSRGNTFGKKEGCNAHNST